MQELIAQIDSTIADARLAAIPGAIGNDPNRDGDLYVSSASFDIERRIAPSRLPLAVAINGPGMFAFDDHGQRVYGRLGDFRIDRRGALVDGRGLAVLGYIGAVDAGRTEPTPIRVFDAWAPTKYHRFEIDEQGVLWARAGVAEAGFAQSNSARMRIGQIALALFPSPEKLQRVGQTIASQTRAAGRPTFVTPGEPNVGVLRTHALEAGVVDLEGDLAQLWRQRRRGEVEAAVAYSADACARTAMGLVK